MRPRALPAIVALLVIAAGCHLFDDDDWARIVPFNNVEESRFLAVTEAQARVFLEDAEWNTFWTEHSEEEAPGLDFEREMAIGLFWGGGYSGCTSRAEVIRVVLESSSRVVVEVDPLGSLGDCDMVVLPNQVIRLERIDKPVRFDLIMRGAKAGEGEAYGCTEAANGELGFYVVSDGGGTPQRVRCHPPCFANMQTFDHILPGLMVPDAAAVLGSLNIIAGELDR